MKNYKEHLLNHNFPKQLSDLMNSNQFLKIFAVAALGLAIFALITLMTLGFKPPIVISLSESAVEMSQKDSLPKPEDQIQQAAKRYVSLRYKWEPANVVKNLELADVFIHPTSKKAYLAAVSNVVRFSSEKQVSQRAYANLVAVNLQSKTVTVTGDRITSIQGMMAAGPLKVELTFENGDRTKENPWGVYFVKEKESL
jgi:hypothetical protein